MCGIAGKLHFQRGATAKAEGLYEMLRVIQHRGPDEKGIHVSGQAGLAHSRLKIIDLTTGKQPLCNEDGTIWIVYNGEIYNFRELKHYLIQRGHQFKTATDTEVIVHLYEELGAECVRQLRGMFSFALWDDRTKTLVLARDRVGIKPLYWCRTHDALLFASEIKAILTDSTVHAEIDHGALDDFLTYFYVPGEKTLFHNIFKLKPGHYMTAKDGHITTVQFWDLSFAKQSLTFGEATDNLEHLLSRTVSDHMISDVPVGVLLSGGVDSTGVLSFASENTRETIRTFTVGFDNGCTDERPFARTAATAFGAHNYEITITAQDFWNCLPKYVWHMEEPVCEPPAIALYYVSKLAREHVTVLLSGEGGDEAFAGYQSYRNFSWLESMKRHVGSATLAGGAIVERLATPGSRYWKYGALSRMSLSDYYFSHSSGPYEYFNSTTQHLYSSEFLESTQDYEKASIAKRYFAAASGLDPLDQMLYVDTKTWLPDDLLIKADKMTMANSLELRVPLLDHQVLEFAASLPTDFKLNRFRTKHILKTALARRVPALILNRKKTGFPVPYTTWLTRDLHMNVADILLDTKTLSRGYFKRQAIEKLVTSRSHKTNYAKELFSLATLELWHRTFTEKAGAACSV